MPTLNHSKPTCPENKNVYLRAYIVIKINNMLQIIAGKLLNSYIGSAYEQANLSRVIDSAF